MENKDVIFHTEVKEWRQNARMFDMQFKKRLNKSVDISRFLIYI